MLLGSDSEDLSLFTGDSIMAESRNEASGSLEVLEASDEGKKKSKFKAFKNCFGKKKKKEPEDSQGGWRLKSSASSDSITISFLKPIQEGQQPKPRIKRSMGNKCLSHDSIFMLEPEISTSKTCHSPEPQRGRSLQRSHVFESLPRTGSVHEDFSGAVFGVVSRYVPRSRTWIADSRITEIPPLHLCQPGISPLYIKSDIISKDFEEISVDDDKSPKTPRKKLLPENIPMLKKEENDRDFYGSKASTVSNVKISKRSLEYSSELGHSQPFTTFAMLTSPSSTQLPIGFSTPATTQGYLDSSDVPCKMILNPQNQKKNFQATVKPKQEEPNLAQVSEEKSTNKPKEADEKNTQKDNAGPSSQEQNNEIEIYDKTTDQSANTDAAESQGYLWSAARGRQHGRKGSSALENSECEPKERSSKQSCPVLDLGNTADSTPADKTAEDSLFWHLSLEEQVMGEPIPPQAETATPQKLLSDKNEMERRKASLDFEVREASTSHLIPEDPKESIVSGLSPYYEDGASGAEKTETRACLLPVVESPFTTQEDIMFSVAVRAQPLMDPSHNELEEEDASIFDSEESVQFKMESSRDIASICKESPPGNVLQTCTASISDIASVFAEGSISAERLSLRSLSQSLVETKAEEVFSDSENASEEGSGYEKQLAPRHSFQSLGKVEDDQEELSSSHGQLAPRSASQSLGEPENEVFTESSSYVEKYNSADDWSSSEGLSSRCRSLALEKPEDQQEVSSVSKNTPGLWSVFVEQIPPRHLSQPLVRPFVQQQVSSGSMSASADWELMPPRHTFQPWESPKSKQQDSAGLESTALDWDISMKTLPPRMTPEHLMKHKVKQPVSSGPEISAVEGITSMELQPPRHHSQFLMKPTAEQEISAGPESPAAKGNISVEPPPMRHPFQSCWSPKLKQKVSSFPEDTADKERNYVVPRLSKDFAQPLMNPKVEQNVFSGSEAAETVISVEALLPQHFPQSLTNAQAQHSFSENVADNEGTFVQPLPQKYFCQPLESLKFQPKIITSKSANTSTEWSGPVDPVPPGHTLQPWESPKSKQQDSAGLESTALDWDISMKTLPPRMTPEHLMKHKVKQPVSSGPEISAVEGITSMELQPPRHHSQFLMKPTAEQEISAGPESPAAKGNIFVEPPPMRHPFQSCWSPKLKQKVSSFPEDTADKERNYVVPRLSKDFAQPLMNPKVEQNVFSGSEAAETVISVEALLPQHFPQSLTNAQAQHSFSENVADNEGIFVQPLPQKYFCQPLESLKFQPKTITSKSASASTEWSGPVDPVPPRDTFQPWESLRFEQHICSDPESTAVEWGIPQAPLPPRMPSQPLMRSVVKQEVFSGSMSAPAEWSGPTKLMPPRHAFQPLMSSKFRQQAYASSGRAVAKRSSPMGWMTPRNVFQPLVNPKFEKQASSSSKRAVAERSSHMVWMPPRNAFQPWVSHKSERQASASSKRAVVERNSPMEWMPPRHVFQPWVSPKFEWQAPVSSERAVAKNDRPMEWMPPRSAFQPWVSHKSEQQASASSKRAVVERNSPMEWMPPRRVFQPWVSPKSERQASVSSERAVAENNRPMEWMPPRSAFQPWVSHKSEQQASASSKRAVVERSSPMEWMPPRHVFQPWVSPKSEWQASASSERAVAENDRPMEWMPPRNAFQPWVSHKSEQQASASSMRAVVENSSPMEWMPPRHVFQPLVSPKSEWQVSASSERAVAENSSPMEQMPPRMPSQSPVRLVVKQEVFSGSMNAPAEWSGAMEPMPPRKPSQPWMKPVVKQSISEGPKNFAFKGDTSAELLPPRNWSVMRHDVQQMSSFESDAVEGGIFERSSKYPSHFLMGSKVQEIMSHLENTAVEGGTSKKLLLPKHPSQSFVKFMAQQIFSETPAIEEQIYVDPVYSEQPSKSFLRPKVEYQIFSDWKRADIEGGISLKLLPTKCPSQSLGRPEDPQEVFSHSESAPVKWISSQEQLPPRYLSQKLGELENQQNVLSVSKSSPKEWWFQAEDGAEFQPYIFSTDSASVPVERISAKDDHLPPRHPFQAFPDPKYQQQVYSCSMNAPAKGNIFESNPSSWPLLRGPASQNKTRIHGQDSEDFIKNNPTPATKPMKFTISPAWPTSTSGDIEEEVLKNSDCNNSYSDLFPCGADVENCFGVQLRRIPSSQKQESEKQDHFTKLSSLSLSPVSSYVSREPQIRSASQGPLGIRENVVTTISDFAEKQQNRTRSGSMAKKQPAYKIPGKPPIQQSEYATSEPAWIPMVKQRQRNFPTHIPMKELKTSNRAEAKSESKKPRYEGAENQHRKIFTSNVNRQEKMAQMYLPKSTNAGFEYQKIFQVPSTRKEIRKSSSLPTILHEPFEPVWFSLARKIAKTWSHVEDM